MRILALIVAIVIAAASSGEAQRRGGRGGFSVRPAEPGDFDGLYQFCRVAFRGNRAGDGGGWGVDYPRADINMSIRLSELTKTKVSFAAPDEPNHLVVQLTSEALFQCPFVMMTEVGAAYLDDAEAKALHDYVTKGGFLWADDFWGSYAWEVWESQLRKALPAAQYAIRDLPPDHPLFRSQFIVTEFPQIPSIQSWRRNQDLTSERGADSEVPEHKAILDRHGNVMVFMTHNTDISDAWEREGEDPRYFYQFSPRGYAVGINVMLYAMTH